MQENRYNIEGEKRPIVFGWGIINERSGLFGESCARELFKEGDIVDIVVAENFSGAELNGRKIKKHTE